MQVKQISEGLSEVWKDLAVLKNCSLDLTHMHQIFGAGQVRVQCGSPCRLQGQPQPGQGAPQLSEGSQWRHRFQGHFCINTIYTT